MATPPSVNMYAGSSAAMALLKPTVSWSQVRADRDRQLQYQAALTQDAQAKQGEAEQAEMATQQAVASLYDVPFLEQDENRWRDLVDGLLDENEKKVQDEYAGDHERYARERYKQDTTNLISKVSKAPLFKQAMKRRSDVVQLMADQSKGLIDRPVTYRLKDGTMKTAPATQNYLDFQAGKTEDFQYGGGYQAPQKWNEFFQKNYHPQAAVDPTGKYRPYQAGATEIMGAMLAEDGMNPQDAADYLRRFGTQLAPTYYKFDPRDPLAETGLKLREQQIRQQGALGKERNAIGWQNARIAQQNANTSAKNAATNAKKLELDKTIAGQGFNAYGTSIDPRNIITTDAGGTPSAVPATVYEDGKAQKTPWSIVGYDAQLIRPQIMAQLGVQERKSKEGAPVYVGGRLKETYVKVPNAQGGYDLRKTDLSGLRYQVVEAGAFYRRNMTDAEKTAYERAGGPEKIYPELTIRISADEALKAKKGRLFNNVFDFLGATGGAGNVDSVTGAGAYRKVKGADGKTYYDFPVVEGLVPTAATRAQMENTSTGRWMDSKAGGSSMGDYNTEMAPGPPALDYNLYDDLDND